MTIAYYPRLYDLLGHTKMTPLSKPNLSKLVRHYIRRRKIEIVDDNNRIIMMTKTLKELTGLDANVIYLVRNGEIEVDWWQLIGMISDKWKIPQYK